MEKTSKLTAKKLIILLAAVFTLAIGGIVTLSFAKNSLNRVSTSEEYAYMNPDETKAETDEGFKIDGVLDEEQYQNNNWLYLHNENGESTVDIAMTSYYGDKGMYFVWDVTENTPIYVNTDRSIYLNSSVEMYFAPKGVSTMYSNDVFEVDMLPTGDLAFKQRNGKDGWMFVPTTDDIMAYLGATTKGGDLNTKDCYGYNLELFIPWEYMEWLGVDAEEMRKDYVFANTAHNTSFNYEGEDPDIDRFWYSFASQLGGDGFGNVDQYFKFNGAGVLGTVPIKFEQGEHYTITGATTVIPGLKSQITITPDEGYALTSILVNENEWIKKVSYNEDGSVTLLVKGVKDGLTISAATVAISQGNKTLSGKVIMNKIDGDSLEGVSISYKGPEGEKPITLDSNGCFELKDLKQGYYTIIVEKEGYTKLVRKICLNRDIDTELTLEYQVFDLTNNAWDIEDENNGTVWKKSRRSGLLMTKNAYQNFAFGANFRYDDALSKVSDGDNYTQQRSGLRIKFSNDKYWHVNILPQDDKYIVQYAKHMEEQSIFDWTAVYTLSEQEIAAYKSEEGIELKVVRNGQYGNVYLGDKLIAIEDLGKEFKACTANLGFEVYVSNQEFMEINYSLSTSKTDVKKECIFARGGLWDISKQFDGVVSLYYGGNGGNLRFAKDYVNMDLTLWVKDDPKGTDPEEQSPRTDVRFSFENDKFVTFSVLRVNEEKVIVQSMGDDKSITGWKEWYDLSEEEIAQYNSEKGIPFRIVRIGTEFSLYIGDKAVGYQDFAGDIKENTKATVDLRHWGDEGVELEIPFKVTENFEIVTITDVGNGKGKVVTQKKNHFVGDTVVLIGDGEYYCYEMKVDNNKIEPNQDGTYSFVATKKAYTVEGTFAKRIFVDNEDWNTLSQKDGLVYLPNGGGDDKPLQFYKEYVNLDLKIQAKNDSKGIDPEEQSPRTDIKFEFEDGRCATFSVLRVNDEQVIIQSMGGKSSLTGWKSWYNLTEAERNLYNSEEGIAFRVVRVGTSFSLYIGDKYVNSVDLADSIKENDKATVYLRHWGDYDVKLDIPFELTEEVDKVAKIGNKYYPALEAAISAAKDGDTVVVLKDVTWNAYVELKKTLTITNEGNVTITRGSSLIANGQMVDVPASGNLTIKGAQGTTFTIDGASTEATDSRFSWVGGTLTFDNVTVTNFKSTSHGAVVFNAGKLEIASGAVFAGNESNYGGAIYNKGELVIESGAVFEENKGNYGGAIYNLDGAVTDNGATYKNNISNSGAGGALRNQSGTMKLTGSRFIGNTSNDVGGAVYATGGSPIEAVECYFEGNKGIEAGAVYHNGTGSVIKNCTFKNNVKTGSNYNAQSIGIASGTIENATFESDSSDVRYEVVWLSKGIAMQAVKELTSSGNAITITPVAYQKNTQFVVDRTNDDPANAFASSTRLIEVTPNNDGNWAVNSAGYLAEPVAKVSDTNRHYASLEDAIKEANNNDTVVVLKDVTWNEYIELKKTITITNEGNVTITRGSNLIAYGQMVDVPASGNLTIKGAQGTTFTIDGASTEATDSRFSWVGGTLTFDNVTVTNFKSTTLGAVVFNQGTVNFVNSTVSNNGNETQDTHGGAVWNKGGTVTTTNTDFSNNKAGGYGGAIGSEGGTIEINGGNFTENEATQGGAICCWDTQITIDGTPTFSENITTSHGGAIRTGGATILTIKSGIFSENEAGGSAGAIYPASDTTITKIAPGVQFIGNKAKSGSGGAIYNSGQIMLYTEDSNAVSQTTSYIKFEGNTSTSEGGAIYNNTNGKITLTGCEFKENQTKWNGGAIIHYGTEMTLTGCKFDTNVCDSYGGAIHAVKDATLTECEFVNNRANYGGAIMTPSGGTTTITLKGCTFTGNYAQANGGALYIWTNDKVILQKSGDKVNWFTNNHSSNSAVNNQETCHGSTGKTYVKDGASYYYNHINLASGQCECSTEVAQFLYQQAVAKVSSTNRHYISLKDAIEEADNNDTVVLYEDVTWNECIELEKTLTITNEGNVTITRGNSLIADGEMVNVLASGNLTIKGAQGTTLTIDGASTEATASRFSEVDGALNLDNVTVTNFKSTDKGAVVYSKGTVTTTNTIFKNNQTNDLGGAIGSEGGKIEINGGSFTGNEAYQGGAVWCKNTQVTIDGEPTFSGNKTTSHGGAIRADEATTLTIKSGKFEENESGKGAGAIYAAGTATITKLAPGVQFIGNEAKAGSGGAIYNSGEIMLYTEESNAVSQTTSYIKFEGNTATSDGGAIFINSNGKVTLTGCEFKNNRSNNYGGAIFASGPSATFIECKFEGNQANYGGVLLTESSGTTVVTFKGCTFNNNYAQANGGALYIWKNDKVILQKSGDKVNVFTNNYSSGSAVNDQETCHGSAGKDYVKDGTSYFYNHINLAGNPVGQCVCSTEVAQFNY